ncbi:RpiB/LacA/LacB family sugar-phosphate isomerase [Patescibacteria group bacterium]|nr:RpiB/LacA/LacB family sugar-phosphate isomerase [Patescibacteria group bacterium]
MLIYIGSDHQGFALKEKIKLFLSARGYSVVDLGAKAYEEGDNYPEYAAAVARRVSEEFETARGILICGSGVGVDVVANKFRRVRSALCASPDQAFDSRNDDDANVLAMGANYLDDATAHKIVITWLQTPFSGEARYRKRLEEVANLEERMLNQAQDLGGGNLDQ